MIGNKTERVKIIRRGRVKDRNGNYTIATSTVAERWASVRPVAGQENEQAGRQAATMRHRVTLDLYGLTVAEEDLIIWLTRGNVELNIREVRLSTVRNIDTVLICEAGAVNGAAA